MPEKARVFPDRIVNGAWRVEREVDDGAIEVAVFSGPDAHERALTFARRYYGDFDEAELHPMV